MTRASSTAPVHDEGADLSRLNAAERTALGLLAQGHTVKSIATITGKSVGSINERLREARRKTGVSSSRELARLFATQENRDELIGVAPAATPEPTPAMPAASSGMGWMKGLVMIGLSGGVLAAIAMVVLVPQADPVTDPLAGVFMVPTGKPDSTRDYYLRLRAEARDANWADEAEEQLRRRYLAVPGIAAADLRVTCRATLCEVAGRQRGTADTDPIEPVGETMRDRGFSVAMTGMNNLGIDPRDMRFLVYFKRIATR